MHDGGLTATHESRTSQDADEASLAYPRRLSGIAHENNPGSLTEAAVAHATSSGSATRHYVSRRRLSFAVAQFVAIDLGAAVCGVLAAFVARFGTTETSSRLLVDLLVAVLLPVAWIALVALNRGYDLRFAGVGTAEFGATFRSFLQLAVAFAFVAYAAQLTVARGFVLLALPLTLAFSCVGRSVARLRLRRLRRTGQAMNRVLAVGSATSVQRLAESMASDHMAGLRVVGACVPTEEADDAVLVRRLAVAGVGVLGDYDAVRASVDLAGARSVAVVAGDVGTAALRMISWELEGSGADLIVSSGLTEVAHQRVHVQSVAGLPLLRVDQPEFAGFRRVLKGVFDRTAAAAALILLSPVFLVVGALVRLTSRGPAFYRQTRIGLNGAPFRIVKFRTMRTGADTEIAELADRNEAVDGLLFKIREDPRVTRFGRILRRFSLDELPQLVNVVAGSMSLVGPRPPLPVEVAQYRDEVSRRLLVKPGLTGLWQISGRSDLSWEESVRLDLHYVENWSFALDMVVLLKTARAVVKASGAY